MTLADLTRVEVADVLKKGTLAGTLARGPADVTFRYDRSYLDSGGPAIAHTLPLREAPVIAPAGAVPAFFAGLLPEGRRLAAIRAAVKTSADDELSLLLAVGSDAIGDVQVLPQGGSAPDATAYLDIGRLDQIRFREVFAAATGGRPDLTGIPGVQDKVSAAMMQVPVRGAGHAGAPTAYILKLEPPEFRHLVANEALGLRVARLSGITTAGARVVHDADGAPGLLVSRFDRPTDGTRLGFEDGCQVLGRYPADRYRVTTEEVLAGLARCTDAPLVALREHLRMVAVAYLWGNGDLHARNLGVLERSPGVWRTAPAFDLPSSFPYGDRTLALSLDGQATDPGRRAFLAAGAAVGLPERAVARLIDEVVSAVPRWVGDIDGLAFDARIRATWRREVARRADRLST